ncbi:unnamed protein product [Cladocopium goreaui]|uniref:Peptidylprolyl isomerase n=1 Tax=Cladocopium goreaui TaxID=2562237 RepID=A0A9P1FS89_9DINO|nr:unnamed protein product [Cladocopium goreaui]
MFDEFRESYLQDDTTSIFMQPYSKYLVGVNALILALIVPCFGFFGAKRNNRPCLGCFVCCSCCGGCLHVLHAILMILLLIGLSSVETVCRRNGSCVGIMEACKYRKSDGYALDTYEGCLDYLVSKFPVAYAGLGLVLGLNSVVICFQCFSARWGYELHQPCRRLPGPLDAMDDTVDDDFIELPKQLTGRDVALFLDPFGFQASTQMDWQKGTENPEFTIRVHGHSTCGRHLHYIIECHLWRGKKTPEERPWVEWKVSRRLAHLRAGLHDLVKHYLGSSYQTYFCQVPFAHRLRPVGTTGRLDRWCSRMAVCLSSRLVPPIVAANVLRVLGAPDLKSCELPGVTFCDQMCSEADSHGPTDLPTQDGDDSSLESETRNSEEWSLSTRSATG